jgi:hypothetical protein
MVKVIETNAGDRDRCTGCKQLRRIYYRRERWTRMRKQPRVLVQALVAYCRPCTPSEYQNVNA